MKPLRLLPQRQLLGSQASAHPTCQISKLNAAVRYPEIICETPQNRIQVVNHLCSPAKRETQEREDGKNLLQSL